MKRYTFLAMAGAAVGALVGAEYYLRRHNHATNRDRWFHEEYDGAHPYIVFHNRSGWELMPGYSVAGIRINDCGFRGAEIQRKKDPSVVRIMCIGDSCTFGAPGEDSPYPSQLERELGKMELENVCQVINAGVDDHSTINAQLRLPRLLAFEPDVLIVYIGWNDMWMGNPKQYPDMRRKTRSYWHYGNGGDTGLRLLDEAKEILELNTPPSIGSFALEDFQPTNFEYNLRRLIRNAKNNRVRVVLTTLPTLISANGDSSSIQNIEKLRFPSFFAQGDVDRLTKLYDIYDASIRRMAMEEDTDLVDLNNVFAGMDGERNRYFSDTWHPTIEGSQVIAQTLARGLHERNIVG